MNGIKMLEDCQTAREKKGTADLESIAMLLGVGGGGLSKALCLSRGVWDTVKVRMTKLWHSKTWKLFCQFQSVFFTLPVMPDHNS